MNENSAEPVLVDCQYCQGKHEKDKVQFCPLNPNKLQYVEEIATFDQADFDKLLTRFSGIRRRDLLYGSWVSASYKPVTHITHNLSARVEKQGDLVIILESHGTEMQETLAPGQVVNLFLDWLQSVDASNRLYAWERLNKEGKR